MDNNGMNIADSIEDDCKVKRVKESIVLLKQKMCKTHDLIKQYADNMNQIDYLKSHLETAKKEAKHTISNYTNALDKIRKLELKIGQDKQESEKVIKKMIEYKTNVAADKKQIQQLTCKIKDLEANGMEYDRQKSAFEEQIKDLEYKIKQRSKAIPTPRKKEKKIISTDSDTAKLSTGTKSTSDIGINVSLGDNELSAKREVQDKSILTDEFYNTKDDPFPLFCAKCEAHLSPDLTPEKICKTMSTYPELIERNLSPLPKNMYSPPCPLPNTYLDSTNRYEGALSRTSMPQLSLHSSYSDSIVGNPKSQLGQSSTVTQICENVESKNMDISHIPVVASLPNNLDLIPTALALSQNRNCAREDFCSDDLLVKHSSSIKEMERKIQLLESKMKKFRRLKEKVDNNSCCSCSKNCKDDILLNSKLISIICKSVAEYYDEKRETCFKNKRAIDSERCTCCIKKAKLKRRQQLSKSNACKHTLCKIENCDEKYQVRNMFCNKTENATKTIDISQCEHTLSVHKNNSFSDTNTSSTSLNDTDEFVPHEKSISHSTEVACGEDSLTTSCLSADEMCVSDNSLDKDDVEAMDVDNETETETIFLPNDENFTDHTYDKTVYINAEKNKIRNKCKNINKDKVGEIYANDNLLNKDDLKTMGNQTKTGTIFLSNDKHSTDHSDGKIVDINAGKNKIKNKIKNIHKDEVGEIHASNNILNKDNVKAVDMDNQTETGTTFLSNNENSTDHTDVKIVDINAEKNKVKNKGQNIHKDKIDEICVSDLLSKNNIEAMDNQRETGRTSLSKDEDSIDHADSKVIDINAEENKIKRKGQNMRKTKVVDIRENRILKKLRNLKRKTRENLPINKQESIESCSDLSFEYNKLPKKSRIENEEESGDRSLKSNTNDLKKNLNTRIETINKQENNTSCSDDYEPAKKLRIAHTPKTSVPQLSNIEDNSTYSTIRNIAALVTRKSDRIQQLGIRKDNLLTESKKSQAINKKCDEKDVESIETNSIDGRPINEKDLTSTEKCLQNNDMIALPAINTERVSEFEKCDDVLIKDTSNRSISMDRAIGETSSNNDEPNVLHNNIANDAANYLELESIPLMTRINAQSKSSTLCKNNRLTEALETNKTKKEITPTAYEALGNKSNDDHKIPRDAISNGESSVLHDRSNVSEATRNESNNNSNVSDGTTEVLRAPSPKDSGTIVEDCTNDNNVKESLDEMKNEEKQKETCVNNEINEKRTIETQRENVRVNQRGEETKFIDVSHKVEKSQTPMSRLVEHINQKQIKKLKLTRKQMKIFCKKTDQFVKKQIRKLINGTWEEAVHDDIIEKLASTCGPRIIAKSIVEFLLEEVNHSEALDKSFTPPAPLMTTSEQKIITLLVDLEGSRPTVIHFVQAAIEYNLFRLNNDAKTPLPVDSLTRIYVVLSRLQKDREKIRMMCCNALYCMGLKSIALLYTVLTCWPEVLPNAEANKGILPKCIAFLISSQKIENPHSAQKQSVQKLNVLKNYILQFYNYNFAQEATSDIVKQLLTTLKAERVDGLDTAIILVAKKEGSSWTYKNIIESTLLPMIIRNEHPCIYSAFSLLGRLLRAFPLEDNNVKNISEQLADLIKSGQGSHDQQEGIISALLSLSRQKFNFVAPYVIKWKPSESLRPITNTQLQAFINARNSKWWKELLGQAIMN